MRLNTLPARLFFLGAAVMAGGAEGGLPIW